ncbi:MAG TPA: ATP-grasp domain-containing protein [Gemmatimonadales bacterium]|jgi:D-alanine-D-alanine ligase-like ATP-grasp enzyme|nr:ATP-grasp domain-containing protein [Gemmatimonadales bacterium]
MPRLLLLLPTTTYRTTAFVEAARQIGVELTVASEQPSTLEAANPAGFLTLDFEQPERDADAVRVFAKQYPINGVVGVDDKTAVVAAAIATKLELRGNPVHAAIAASDKYLQRELLAKAGVPIPRFLLRSLEDDPATIANSISYPCVLKPVRLSASRGVMRADNPQSFRSAHERLRAILAEPETAAACGDRARQYLIEEFIPGYEVALEGLVVNRRLHVLAVFDKPDPLDGPYFEETIYVTPSSVPAGLQAAIKDCADRAVRALGVVEGPVHAELRYNERGPWLIELAARPIGGRCSAVLKFGEGGRGKGVTLEEIILRHALGMPIPSLQRERLAAGVMMIPIPGPGVLQEVRGVAEAKAVPLVEDVQITAHPGERLIPFPEGSRYPGFIFARGETPAVVEAALRDAHRRLEFKLG